MNIKFKTVYFTHTHIFTSLLLHAHGFTNVGDRWSAQMLPRYVHSLYENMFSGTRTHNIKRRRKKITKSEQPLYTFAWNPISNSGTGCISSGNNCNGIASCPPFAPNTHLLGGGEVLPFAARTLVQSFALGRNLGETLNRCLGQLSSLNVISFPSFVIPPPFAINKASPVSPKGPWTWPGTYFTTSYIIT